MQRGNLLHMISNKMYASISPLINIYKIYLPFDLINRSYSFIGKLDSGACEAEG